MSKHTPGPWIGCKGNAGTIINIECKGSGNDLLPIAALRGSDREANANLIASAPTMFEAIGKALTMAQQHDPATGYYKSVNPYELHRVLFRAYCQAQGIMTGEQVPA